MTDETANVCSYELHCIDPQSFSLEPTARAPSYARYHIFDGRTKDYTPAEPAAKAAASWLAERALVTGCDTREMLYRLLGSRIANMPHLTADKRSLHKYKHPRMSIGCTLFCIDTLQELDRIIWSARLAS